MLLVTIVFFLFCYKNFSLARERQSPYKVRIWFGKEAKSMMNYQKATAKGCSQKADSCSAATMCSCRDPFNIKWVLRWEILPNPPRWETKYGTLDIKSLNQRLS